MVREQKDRRLLVGLICDCAAELKFIFALLLLLCCLLTLTQFLPTCFFPLHYSTNPLPFLVVHPTNSDTLLPSPSLAEVHATGVVMSSFNPIGVAAYNFILMSAFRGGPNTFAIMGLSSKPLHVFGSPIYVCEYQGRDYNATGVAYKIIPDFGLGRVYTTLVIICTFPFDTPPTGGILLLHASVNGGFDTKVNATDTILALTESPNSWNTSQFTVSSQKYDYFYCGSPLYGDLSPQRVREWIAYHVRLFGERSHFVFYDAGGVHPEVLKVLNPWMELGYVTVVDVREQERFDAYYHNQFLVINDCLHRYRFASKWMFFFDVDEFIYLPGKKSFASVMDSLEEFSQFTFEQMPMSNHLCHIQDAHKTNKKWGFEKLVYRNVKLERRDRKFAVQPRNVFAAGVHMTLKLKGSTSHHTSHLIRYFHYHGTIAQRPEPCRRFINDTLAKVNHTLYIRDIRMKSIAPLVKSFELHTIGSTLELTRQ